MAFDTLQLRRLSDGLVYQFTRASGAGRSAIYVRGDGVVRIAHDADFGWSICDGADGSLLGRVWDVPPERQGDHPTAGVWVSRKGEKSYVYDLTWD